MYTAPGKLFLMSDTPDLETVAGARRDAFSPTLPSPRIGIPDTDLDDAARQKLVSETLESTTLDLKKVAEQRKQAFSLTYPADAAILYTILAVIVATLTVLVGIWLFNVGVNMDLGS